LAARIGFVDGRWEIDYRMGALRPYEFAWQSRFHDHIIRNAEEHQRIATYIRDNPRKWPADRFWAMARGR
jgi:hypothetical protein